MPVNMASLQKARMCLEQLLAEALVNVRQGIIYLLGSCFNAGNNEIAQCCTPSLPFILLSSSTG